MKLMQITQSRTRQLYPLSLKKILKKTITGTLIATIALLVILGGFLAFGIYMSEVTTDLSQIGINVNRYLGIISLILLGVVILNIVLTYFYQYWYFMVYFYDLTDDYIIIRKDPITPHEITIPYERIQDVYVDQDLFDRIFGLYDVHLSSATFTSGWLAHIDGVEKLAADGLRKVILETITQKLSKHKQSEQNPIQLPQK